MALTEKMLKGAWLLSQGRKHKDCYEGAKVTEKTLYQWLKRDDFKAAVELLQGDRLDKEAEVKKETAEADLNTARDDELANLSIQREIVSELGELTLEFLQQIRDEGLETLSPRQFPAFVKALADTTAMFQNSNDRLIGMESLISDVESLEKEIQVRAESIEERRGTEGC